MSSVSMYVSSLLDRLGHEQNVCGMRGSFSELGLLACEGQSS